MERPSALTAERFNMITTSGNSIHHRDTLATFQVSHVSVIIAGLAGRESCTVCAQPKRSWEDGRPPQFVGLDIGKRF